MKSDLVGLEYVIEPDRRLIRSALISVSLRNVFEYLAGQSPGLTFDENDRGRQSDCVG